MRSLNSMSLSVRTLFLGLSCASSSAAPSATDLRLVVVVVMVVMAVISAAAGEVFRDAALDGALRAGGSAEGARDTLRLRVVVVSNISSG